MNESSYFFVVVEHIPVALIYQKTLMCCETPENPNFLKKGKMIISVKIRNFSRSRMMKRDSPLELSREI